MQIEHLFARAEVYPSWFTNALGYHLSVLADGLTLVRSDATHVQIPAGPNDQAAVVAIEGSWRWIEATLTRAHPGGAAGTYDIFVTAAATDIVATPDPYTDTTNYAFGLAILATGSTPTIVAGTVDIFRKIGSLQWDGAAITRIDQTVPAPTLHAHRHASGQPDAIAPADIGAPALATNNHFTGNQTIDGTLSVGGDTSLSGALSVAGAATLGGGASVTGQLKLPTAGAGAGLLVGGDATLYRDGANSLRTAGALTVDGALTVSGGGSISGQLALPTNGAGGGLLIGDATLYRNAAGSLRTGGAVVIDGVLTVSTSASIAGQLALPATGSGGGLLIGGDATLYRNAASSLRTASALTVDGALTASGGASVTGQLALPTAGSSGGLLIGSDATLYRVSANVLRTGSGLTVDGTLTCAAVNASGAVHLTSAGTALTVDHDVTISGTLTAGAINASGTLHLTGAGTALTVDNNATITGTLTITGGATAPTKAVNDNTTAVATTAYADRAGRKRRTAVTQSATPAVNTDNTDIAAITGLAQAITSMTTNLTGATGGRETLIYEITDNGTARAIAWGASFEPSGLVALPTSTVAGVKLSVGFIWNPVTSKYTCVAVA